MTAVEKRSGYNKFVAYGLIAIMLLSLGYGVGVWSAPVTSFGIDGSGNMGLNRLDTNVLRLDALTSGRIPIAGTAGLMGDDGDLTWTGGDTLTVANVSTSSLYVNSNLYYPEQEVDYTIWVDAGTYYARNGHTGAVTSSADAAALINIALNSGKEVLLKSGSYAIDSAYLDVKSGDILRGEGRNTILESGRNNQGIMSVNDNVVLRDLTIDGNSGTLASSEGIHFPGKNCLIDNVYIKDCDIRGIYTLSTALNNTISNCLIENCGTRGIQSSYSNIKILNNIIRNCFIGIEVENANNIVTGNYIYSSTNAAIFTNSVDAKRCQIKNNYIDTATTDGISFYLGDSSLIQGNVIKNTEGDAIILSSALKITVTGNEITGTTSTTGIVVYNSTNSIISDNNIYGSEGHGIGVALSSYCVISNNRISNSDQNGIALNNSTYNAITGNVVTNSGLDAVPANTFGVNLHTTSTYNTLTGNTFTDTRAGVTRTQTYGIRDDGSDYNIYINNIVNNNLTGGITSTGVNTKIHYNQGFVTENSGTAGSIALGVTHQHITHGLSYTPTAADIGITWTTSLTNCTSYAVTGISSTEFVVNLYDATGAAKGPSGTVTYSWKAIKTP